VILVIYAHPHPRRSIAGAALLGAVRDLDGLTVHSLYDRYADFAIDADAERERLSKVRLVIWQHPLYWYGVHALMKLWLEEVLVRGWAYGDGGTALAGKDCLWVASTGATSDAYSPGGKHAHAFEAFQPAVEQTARFCSMNWLPPIIVHGAHLVGHDVLESHASAYRARLDEYLRSHV
jgi:glutathione-regulated potassium-efflux system ancillary protein KefF